MTPNERRILFTADARFAATPAVASGGSMRLSGYALVWNTLSDDRGGYKVKLAPRSAKFADPTRALFHHDIRAILGTTENATVRLTMDDVGARFEIDLPNTTLGRDTFELVDKKYVRGMSFAMTASPWAVSGYGPNGPTIVAIPGQSMVSVQNGETIVTALQYTVDEITITPDPSFLGANVDAQRYAAYRAANPHPIRRAQSSELDRLTIDILRPGLALPPVAV